MTRFLRGVLYTQQIIIEEEHVSNLTALISNIFSLQDNKTMLSC